MIPSQLRQVYNFKRIQMMSKVSLIVVKSPLFTWLAQQSSGWGGGGGGGAKDFELQMFKQKNSIQLLK